MTLKDCTKEELLFIIERLRFYNAENSFYAERALSEAYFRRERKKLEQARELTAYIREKREEYWRLSAHCDGTIPTPVLTEAAAILGKIREAERKWDELMGIGKTGQPPEDCT